MIGPGTDGMRAFSTDLFNPDFDSRLLLGGATVYGGVAELGDVVCLLGVGSTG